MLWLARRRAPPLADGIETVYRRFGHTLGLVQRGPAQWPLKCGDTAENRPFSRRVFARGLVILATGGTLASPAILPYPRGIADALLSLIAMLFLISRYVIRIGWVERATHSLWSWMLFCILIAAKVQTAEQAVAAPRFFVFTAALGRSSIAPPALVCCLLGVSDVAVHGSECGLVFLAGRLAGLGSVPVRLHDKRAVRRRVRGHWPWTPAPQTIWQAFERPGMKICIIGKIGSVTHWLEDCAAGLIAAGHVVQICPTRNPKLSATLERLLLAHSLGAPRAALIVKSG